MATGMIYASNVFIMICLCVFSNFAFPDENSHEEHAVFYKFERNEDGGLYYKETSYRLINELNSRCLYSVLDKTSSPRLIGGEETKIVVELMYSSSKKNNGACILDNSTYKKSSLVFFNFKLDEFIDLEGRIHEFLASDCFKKKFLSAFSIVNFYPFSVSKADEGSYTISILADGAVYDVSANVSGGFIEIIKIDKAPDINL
jgi:hypothetical protein